MTVAAFLLECETCHDKIGLMTGAVESFICWSCAAEKMFGSGKVVSGETKAVAAVETAPVPANPGPVMENPSHSPAGPGPFSIQDALDVRKAIRDTPGAVSWTPDDVRVALKQGRLPNILYGRLTAYAALFRPDAVYMGRVGRLVLRQCYDDVADVRLAGTTVLTDVELTEALR